MKKHILLLITIFIGITLSNAQNTPVNVNSEGVMLEGHDVIEFFRYNIQEGAKQYSSDYKGAVYYFKNAENKTMFDAHPYKYAPQFGGYCAVALALEKKLKPVELWSFSIVNGKLIFNHNEKAYNIWIKDVQGTMDKAQKNWPSVAKKQQ